MAHDEELAEHIRLQLAGRTDVVERRMFGGIGFMVGGHLTIASNSAGDALVRVGTVEADRLVASTNAERAVMGTRTMKGWMHVPAPELDTASQVRTWLDRSLAFVATLPDKPPRRR